MSTLTRLTREAFAELTRVKERLDDLEEEAGIGGGGGGSGGGMATAAPLHASAVAASGGRPRSARAAPHHARHRPALTGLVQLGGGLMWAQVGRANLTALHARSA